MYCFQLPKKRRSELSSYLILLLPLRDWGEIYLLVDWLMAFCSWTSWGPVGKVRIISFVNLEKNLTPEIVIQVGERQTYQNQDWKSKWE